MAKVTVLKLSKWGNDTLINISGVRHKAKSEIEKVSIGFSIKNNETSSRKPKERETLIKSKIINVLVEAFLTNSLLISGENNSLAFLAKNSQSEVDPSEVLGNIRVVRENGHSLLCGFAEIELKSEEIGELFRVIEVLF